MPYTFLVYQVPLILSNLCIYFTGEYSRCFWPATRTAQDSLGKICLKTIVYCDRTNVYTKAIAPRVFPTSSAEILQQQLPSVGMAGLHSNFIPSLFFALFGGSFAAFASSLTELALGIGLFRWVPQASVTAMWACCPLGTLVFGHLLSMAKQPQIEDATGGREVELLLSHPPFLPWS